MGSENANYLAFFSSLFFFFFLIPQLQAFPPLTAARTSKKISHLKGKTKAIKTSLKFLIFKNCDIHLIRR